MWHAKQAVLKGTIAQLAKIRKKMARAELAPRPDPKVSGAAPKKSSPSMS
jgi:hypothetical protein